jgi:phage shock protein C
MNMRGQRFETDKANGKVLGVCAGIANATGVDATIIRIAAVILTIMGGFPWTLIAYGVAAMVGKPRGYEGYDGYAPARSSATREEARERMRALDLRMQAIETYVTSSNSKLAREIEELR